MRAHVNRERRLPTRVSTACDRCRRRKQRCDDRSPCSNCMSVSLACTTSLAPIIKRPRLVNRMSTGDSVPRSPTHMLGVQRPLLAPKSSLLDSISTEEEHDQSESNMRIEPAKVLEAPVITDQSHVMQNSPASITSSGTRARRGQTISDFEEGGSTASITKQIFDKESSNSFHTRETFAIPGAEAPEIGVGRPEQNSRMTICEVLGVNLPPIYVSDALLETYFQSVHWFSLVVHEQRFRVRYREIVNSGGVNMSDRGFLLLIAMILVMGSWYSSEANLFQNDNMPYNITTMRNEFLKLIRSSFMDLMDEDSIEFVQLSTLLGSFYLYYSGPRAAFSILGAATKTAQAMRLHRESYDGLSFEEKEERKRVWWTVYTWDRFAAIIYGRPLGVNDRDCNVSMPSLFDENITFDPKSIPSMVCLSAYQVQLNMVYRIASPVLENLCSIKHSQDSSQWFDDSVRVAQVGHALEQWRLELPPFLNLDTIQDISAASSASEKAHSLQALSLQLTYDNLVMVINRPLFADSDSTPQTPTSLPVQERSLDTPISIERRKAALRRCLDSALSISKVQRNGNLIRLAQKTHLISFVGINLFTASVVLYICACSNILSNIAQEAKRGISRILHLQKLLSSQASLSMQCSVILEDLLHLVLKKEKEALLSSEFDDEYIEASKLENRANMTFHDTSDRMEDSDALYAGSSVDMGANLDSTWAAPVGNMSYYNDYLRESLLSLQRVVQGSASETQIVSENQASFPAPSNMQNGENWRDPDPPAYNTNNAEADTRIGDLGQFWLWDLQYN